MMLARSNEAVNFMDTFTIHAENINVADIMQEIQRRVLEKKQAGVYTDGELQRIAELKANLSPQKDERYSEMSLHLRRLHHNWDAAASGAIISSHRKFVGPMLVFIKRVGFKIFRFIGSGFFTRQTEYNAAGVRFNAVVLEELSQLKAENRQLQQTQQELARQIEFLQQQLQEKK